MRRRAGPAKGAETAATLSTLTSRCQRPEIAVFAWRRDILERRAHEPPPAAKGLRDGRAERWQPPPAAAPNDSRQARASERSPAHDPDQPPRAAKPAPARFRLGSGRNLRRGSLRRFGSSRPPVAAGAACCQPSSRSVRTSMRCGAVWSLGTT